MAGWVGVEIEVNANSAPNLVGVGAGAELGKIKMTSDMKSISNIKMTPNIKMTLYTRRQPQI